MIITDPAFFCCRYVKGHDPGNWLIIDPKTADIRLKKMPDRESPLLKNGTYFAEILCMTDGTHFHFVSTPPSDVLHVTLVSIFCEK